VQIQQRFVDEMIAHSRESMPNECCGILSGAREAVEQLYRMTNVEASPFRFSMDPLEIMKVDEEAGEMNWELLAIYHSHTHSEAYPSDTDVRIAGGTTELWPEVRYILVSLMDPADPKVRLFRINQQVITEETLQVV
jgi:proteasome lid subunit RPN8/RPN11